MVIGDITCRQCLCILYSDSERPGAVAIVRTLPALRRLFPQNEASAQEILPQVSKGRIERPDEADPEEKP